MPARQPTTPIKEVQGITGSGIEPWRYKSDMAREKNKEYFLQHSGDLSNTNDIHRALRSTLHAQHIAGLDCGYVIGLLDESSRLQPDKDGTSRKEAMQLMEEGAVIIPGVGSFGGHQPEPEPGWFERNVWSRFRSTPK